MSDPWLDAWGNPAAPSEPIPGSSGSNCSTVCGTGGWTGPLPGDPDNYSVLSATPTYGGVDVSWTYPLTNPQAVSYIDIYRGITDVINFAVKRATVAGDSYFDRIPSTETRPYYYWIQITSVNGTVGDMIGPAMAEPQKRIYETLADLHGLIDNTFLSQSLNESIGAISSIQGDLANEAAARLADVSAMADAFASVQAETGQALTYIQSEITQRANADEALLDSVNILAVGMADNAAAIVTEQELRATEDSALAENITTLQARISSSGDVGSAIVSAQTTANSAIVDASSAQFLAASKVKTFFQETAPSSASIGDIWIDVDNNNHLYRWSGLAWEDAHDSRINSIASSVTTLQTTVGENTTAIQTNIASIDGLGAQYTVKVDNNGYISGFGLASTPVNGVPYSEFAIKADTFKFGSPDGSLTPFAVIDTPSGYKTILNTDVLIGGSVDIANLKSGSLASDVQLSLGGGVIDLDGSGEIRVYKDLAPDADYVKLSSGEIRFMRFIDGSYQTYNYLSRLETGVANSGSSVTIPGYWKAQPRVMVSPSNLALYKQAYAGQDQAITCQASNIRETALNSGRWKFDASATLNLADASGGEGINIWSGNTPENSYTFATQTTPENCISISPSLDFKSTRSNASNQYYHRTVRWRIEYLNNGNWVNGPWTWTNIGEQVLSVNATATLTFPHAGVWQWRVSCEAYDTDGTSFGTVLYDYPAPTTAIGTSNGTGYSTQQSAYYSKTNSVALNGPLKSSFNFSVPINASGSGEIYRIDYSYSYTWGISGSSTNDVISASATDPLHPNGHFTHSNKEFNKRVSGGTPSAVVTESFTVTGSNLNVTNLNFKFTKNSGSTYADLYAMVTPGLCTATIYRRNAITTPLVTTNSFLLNSYNYSLSAAQILATGSLNWMAVGE